MRIQVRSGLALAMLGVAAAGCGSSYSSPAPSQQAAGFTLTISGMSFSPLDLRVPPGATVTVVNRDGMAHSVTSEATAGAFAAGAVAGVAFDTGAFTGSRSFTVPSSAPDGTVVPYFCSTHLGTMATPTGTLTIDASARPAAAPPPGGGGGY